MKLNFIEAMKAKTSGAWGEMNFIRAIKVKTDGAWGEIELH
ncbi:hypothetical protein QUF56_08420 [Ureibacillus composti]|nr:hypothetical protein [Ureibacillus composti]